MSSVVQPVEKCESSNVDSTAEWLHVASPRPRESPISIDKHKIGRVAKTLYLLAYLDDEGYRRRILTQLNKGERRHSLARIIFHGQRGEVRQRYRQGQEDQLGALGLVLNCVVLWNTRYLDAALTHLQNQGQAVKSEDVVRLWPYSSRHINVLGRYTFALPDAVARGELRPLRDLAQMDLLEDL